MNGTSHSSLLNREKNRRLEWMFASSTVSGVPPRATPEPQNTTGMGC